MEEEELKTLKSLEKLDEEMARRLQFEEENFTLQTPNSTMDNSRHNTLKSDEKLATILQKQYSEKFEEDQQNEIVS